MSLMADYDMIIEFSNSTILKLIKGNLKINNVNAVPPFEFLIPISKNVKGNGFLIVSDIQINLNENDTITTTLFFIKSSLLIKNPIEFSFCPLDGFIEIESPIRLIEGNSSNFKKIGIDLINSDVTIEFSQESINKITSQLTNTTITYEQVKTTIQGEIKEYIKRLSNNGIISFPSEYRVINNKDGDLWPLQFENLEIHCISNTDKNKQSLALFGTLLTKNDRIRDHDKKNISSIDFGNDVAISISPEIFHVLEFCPIIAERLKPNDIEKLPISELPPSCGSSSGITKDGVKIINFSESFEDGYVNLNGIFNKTGNCFNANGSFKGKIELNMVDNEIVPSVVIDEPIVNVDIFWYCYLVAGILIGPIGILITDIIDSVLVNILKDIANSVKDSLFTNIQSTNIGRIQNASLNNIIITNEGLTINGTVSIIIPKPKSPNVIIDGSLSTVDTELISEGVYTVSELKKCEAEGDWPYKEYCKWQSGFYNVISTLLSKPLQIQWFINDIPITNKNGRIKVPNIATYYRTPIPSGSMIIKEVNIDYQITQDSIHLYNLPSDGNYTFLLKAEVTDCNNEVFSQIAHAYFEGQTIESEFVDKFWDCLIEGGFKLATQLTRPSEMKIIGPKPNELIELIRTLTTIGTIESEELLAYTKLVYANIFNQIILSPSLFTNIGFVTYNNSNL